MTDKKIDKALSGLPDPPLFTHDCSDCTFLGSYNKHDLYHCMQIVGPTIIARWGDSPTDYCSGVEIAAHATTSDELPSSYRALATGFAIASFAGLLGAPRAPSPRPPGAVRPRRPGYPL